MSKQSAGGIATAKILRQAALLRYYENPNTCLQCNQIIHVKNKVQEARVKKFCNQSCAVTYSNFNRVRKDKFCKKCKSIFLPLSLQNKICSKCKIKISTLPETTKRELFQRCKNYQSARSIITHNALKIYNESGKPRICFICSYERFVDVCHIQDVKDFPDSAFIKEINAITNLVTLCPTHHTEFDNHVFSLIH